MDDFKAVNAIYAEFFGNHKPARSAVQVARLPLDALFEIEAIVRSVSNGLKWILDPCLGCLSDVAWRSLAHFSSL